MATTAEGILNRVVLPDWRGPVRITAGNSEAAFLSSGFNERLMYSESMTGYYAFEMHVIKSTCVQDSGAVHLEAILSIPMRLPIEKV